MDELLPAFHGRIQREDWIGQARKLLDAQDEKESVPFN
jgi:predicted flap endonuclease-1-like 5' DNA nuclease